jgi:hypothetical protein
MKRQGDTFHADVMNSKGFQAGILLDTVSAGKLFHPSQTVQVYKIKSNIAVTPHNFKAKTYLSECCAPQAPT